MKKKKRQIYLSTAFCIFFVVILISIYQVSRYVELAKYASASEDRSYYSAEQTPAITYNGKQYRYNTDIRTIVFLGIDKTGALTQQEQFQQAGQSDVILLLSMNSKTKQYFILPVNRDTMIDMTVYGIFGDVLGTETHQLTLAYGYGDGSRISGENTLTSLGKLFHQIPFTGYIACPTDTVSIVNDAVGGITVTVEDDFSGYDSSLVQGTSVTLKGEQAIHFVRGRSLIGDGTNETRMKRQEQFYNGLLTKVRGMDTNTLLGLYDRIISYTKSDLSKTDITSYLSLLPDDSFAGMYHIDGKSIANNGFMEFYPDQNALQQLILKLYFTESK
jgi:Transcriptional regulator